MDLPTAGDRAALFGVLDGHGPENGGGDVVAATVRNEFATCFLDTIARGVDVPFKERGTYV